MNRNIIVHVDRTHFPNGRMPYGFSPLAATQTLNVHSALVHTALHTRPPAVQGIHLADTWAWIRYREAFDRGPELRLRGEWDDIDPHQKTILSDELGVGVTTFLLASVLGYRDFVDTNYLIRVLMPNTLTLGRTSKRGPRKSPDYVGLDKMSRLVALECKGTQSSVTALESAMNHGVAQKRNLRGLNGNNVHMSLVGGLFVPQASSPEGPTVVFWDPVPKAALAALLGAVQGHMIVAGIVQVSLAMQLAMAGMKLSANHLALTPTASMHPFSAEAKDEVRALLHSRVVFEIHSSGAEGLKLPWVRLTAMATPELVEALSTERLSFEQLLQIQERAAANDWQYDETADGARMTTPEGMAYELTYLLRPPAQQPAAPDGAPVPRSLGTAPRG